MADCKIARCQQERRAIRRELQRWTKNMVCVLGLERVAEELMGRRKWKLYQDALLPRRYSERDERDERGEASSEEEEEPPMPAAEPPELPQAPALKIKTIEQINTTQEEENTNNTEEGTKPTEPSLQPKETILESLIKRPSTHPRVHISHKTCPSHQSLNHARAEPVDWKPADKCYFCVEEPQGGAGAGAAEPEAGGGGGAGGRAEGGATSPAASESDSSSVSGGARSPQSAAPPPLLAHLLQLQNHNPQAIAQLQQMMAALAALGTGLMPPAALSQAWLLQRLQQNQLLSQQQQHVDRLTAEMGEKVPVTNCSPSPSFAGACAQAGAEQPLDLSARSGSSTGEPATPPPDTKLPSRVPPIDPKFLANVRLKRPAVDGPSSMGPARRAYTEEELQKALSDIQSGRLGTRRAAVIYGIPRSTLRNKVYKLALDQPADVDADRDSADEDDAEAYRSLLLQAADGQQRDDEDTPGVILKIPTFPAPDRDDSPPPTQVPLYDPPLQHVGPPGPHERLFSLRDVIAKSINQKFHQPPNDIRPDGQPDLAFGRPPDRHISVIKHMPDSHRTFGHANNAGNSRANNNGASQPAGGKGTRPKRGKYRNYDRDSLVEAVKAVQRGEMSVHRAGSYYGVPHSTLEYKVKERHLMRPRKREPKQQPPDNKVPLVTPKPPAPKPPTKPGYPNGMNGPESLTGGYPPAGYPFWSHPASFPALASGSFTPGSELYASHMMQRLREESAPTNGSFLEGIIRSSLDRPANAALLQRLTGEAPPHQNSSGARLNDVNATNLKTNANLLQRLNSDSGSSLPQSATLLQRLTGEMADEGSPPPARRPRLSSSDCSSQLAAEMREAVQRLRADKLRAAGRNGTPTPPAASPGSIAAPADRA